MAEGTKERREKLVERTHKVFSKDRLEGSFTIISSYLKYGRVSVGKCKF